MINKIYYLLVVYFTGKGFCENIFYSNLSSGFLGPRLQFTLIKILCYSKLNIFLLVGKINLSFIMMWCDLKQKQL